MQFDRRIICPIWICSMHDWKTLRLITSSKYSTEVLNIWVQWKSTPDFVYYQVQFKVFLKSPVVNIMIAHRTSESSSVYRFNSSLAQYYTIYIQIYIILYNIDSQAHHLTVRRLRFRPQLGASGCDKSGHSSGETSIQLASCGQDHQVKVYTILIWTSSALPESWYLIPRSSMVSNLGN